MRILNQILIKSLETYFSGSVPDKITEFQSFSFSVI